MILVHCYGFGSDFGLIRSRIREILQLEQTKKVVFIYGADGELFFSGGDDSISRLVLVSATHGDSTDPNFIRDILSEKIGGENIAYESMSCAQPLIRYTGPFRG